MEQNYTCQIWTSMCFLVHHCPFFSSCLQNPVYSIHFYSQSLFGQIGRRRRWQNEIVLEFFLWQSKHLRYFYPQCQAEDGIKKGVRRERWTMKFFQTLLFTHLTQHVLNACHFSDALPGTGYIHFLPTIFQVRTQTASVWSQKLLGKEKPALLSGVIALSQLSETQGLTKTSILVENFWNISRIFKQLCKRIQAHLTSKISRFRWNQLKLWIHTQYFLPPVLHNADLFTSPSHTDYSSKLSVPWFSIQIHKLDGFSGYLVLQNQELCFPQSQEQSWVHRGYNQHSA